METDEMTEEEDDPGTSGEQNIISYNSLGGGILTYSETPVPSPLDITTPEELLTPLARLRSFTNSENIFNRRMIAHDMCNILRAVNSDENDFHSAVSWCLKLSEDLEPSVRVELMEQMYEITELFHTSLLDTAIIPILLRYLTDVNNQVRKACHSVLIDVTKRGFLKVDRFEKEVMPLLNDLTSRKQAPDDYRTEAVALVCQICDAFDQEFVKQHFLPIFLESCRDESMFHVRKVCAGNFSAFCDIFDNGIIETDLLPRFVNLCKDNVWGVRKSCAESFPDFARHASEEVRINTLSPIYSNLLSDQSRWVRVSAYESLGPFISTFADSKLASDQLKKDVSKDDQSQKTKDGISKKGMDDPDFKADFDSFMYWRDPIPLVTFDEDFIDEEDKKDEEVPQDEVEEIQSQVYVNSGSSGMQNEVVVIPASGEDSDDSGLPDAEDSVYSPTKDESSILKSIEFVADNESIPNPFEVKVENSQENQEMDEFQDISPIEINVEQREENNEQPTHKHDSGIPREDLGTGDNTGNVSKEEEVDKEVENEEEEAGEANDENEPKNWQGPSIPDYPDLYDFDYSEKTEIDYRIFGSLSDIGYSQHDYGDKDDQFSTFDPMLSLQHPKQMSQQNIIPQQLLDNFLSMTDPSRKQTVDTEIAKHCAFSLPGVAYTLGRNNWHCLKDVYQKLASDVQWKVRRTIASSIHELAKILGEDLTATELVPVFNGFLKDLDDVRIGVLRHLADFLQLLNPDVRGIYLYQLKDFLTIDNSRNWRFRYELARQLRFLIDLYSPEDTMKYICPISMRLATDRVVAVQEETTHLVATLLAKLMSSENPDFKMQYFDIFREKIIAFLAESRKWKERSVFCKLCNTILEGVYLPFDVFLQHFCSPLISLAKDNIVNVRIGAARALSYAATTFCDTDEGKDIFAALKELQNDKDKDVRYFAMI